MPFNCSVYWKKGELDGEISLKTQRKTMGYMKVDEHTPNVLHLKRSPGLRSWSLLVGISSVGLAAAYYSTDSIFWKAFYVTGCAFVAMQNMEEWEEAVFDKTNNVIELKTFSLYALILTMWRRGQEKVVLDMRHLRDVCVQEEKVRYLGKGYVLVLRLATGFSYPLTQSATMRGRSDVEAVATLLKRFLGLEELQHRMEQESAREVEEDDELDLSTDSEKEGDFETAKQ
ncbi:hypothetical protein DPEC_G00330870 [Dallia pectoralis]|uniref:Uncharacterized protein n=1 Tax=Dallia pectoralis TaxID=75939 RepID=A0ACC2F904_DALPE|nr:hypothetical protein DPEC_G00330870 [Dallia pectoralis]